MESNEFALENVERTNAAERIVKGLYLREAGHVLFDVAHDLGFALSHDQRHRSFARLPLVGSLSI